MSIALLFREQIKLVNSSWKKIKYLISCQIKKNDQLRRERNKGIFEGKGYDLFKEFKKKYGKDLPPENGESECEVKKNLAPEFLESMEFLSSTSENKYFSR